MVQLLPRTDAVAASDLDLAREALVAQLRAAREVRFAALLDLGALELREAVVEDVALAVVALVRARLWDAGAILASVLHRSLCACASERARGYATPERFRKL